MKKAIILLTLILVFAFIAACGNELESPTQEAPATTEVQEIPVSTPEPEIEEVDGLLILQEYLGAEFTIQPWEFTWTEYRWQFLELHDELDLDNFPGVFGGNLISVVLSATEEGDVFIVTTPEGKQYLHINQGSPHFYVSELDVLVELEATESLSWTTFSSFDIRSLTLEMIPELRELAEQRREASTLYVNNPDNVIYWNTAVFNMLPTDEESLTRLLSPGGTRMFSVDSNHPAIIEKAQEITAGLDNDMDKARAIAEWVINNLIADENYMHITTASSVLEHLHSVCRGYMTLTVALLRAAGIPATDMWSYWIDATISGWRGNLNNLITIRDYFNAGITKYMWTGAFIDGRWVLIDTNWMSGGDWGYFDMDINNLVDRILAP